MKSSIDEKPKGVEFQKNADGTANVNYIDLLDEDKPIAGQKFTCLSFLSPEKIIKQKEMFYFEQFIKHKSTSHQYRHLCHPPNCSSPAATFRTQVNSHGDP